MIVITHLPRRAYTQEYSIPSELESQFWFAGLGAFNPLTPF